MQKTKTKSADTSIVLNRKARFNYELFEKFEAGIALHGWELKSLRAKKVQISESYVVIQKGAAWVIGSMITPLPSATASSIDPSAMDAGRTRKLLLHNREIQKIATALQAQGYSCVCLSWYWKKHLVKCQIALAKGKRNYDKRQSIKKRDLEREQQAAFAQSRIRRK